MSPGSGDATGRGVGAAAAALSVFWNADERRVRAGWRVLVQVVLQVVLLLVLSPLLQTVFPAPVATSSTNVAERPYMLENTVIVTVLTVATVWLVGRFLDRRSFASFGFHLRRGWWLDLAFGFVLGGLLLTGIFLAQLAGGWVAVTGTFVTADRDAAFLGALLMPLVLFALVSLQEELPLRGFQLQNFAEGLNYRAVGARGAVMLAWALTSLLFGLNHVLNPGATALGVANVTLAGVLMGVGYVLTGELAIPLGLHFAWNLFEATVFGYPVSGFSFGWAAVLATERHGPELWTGGAFGPEGSLLGTAALLVGTALTVAWVRLRHGGVRFAASIATPPGDDTPRRS